MTNAESYDKNQSVSWEIVMLYDVIEDKEIRHLSKF